MAVSKIINGITGEETTSNWTPIAQTDEEKLGYLRVVRNNKLAETDFYGNSDVTMSDAMTTYRQALRDITSSATSLDDVTWPTKP